MEFRKLIKVQNRGRIGDLAVGSSSKQSDPASSLSMPPPIGSAYSNNNWNSRNIWGSSTIGSGLKSNTTDFNRQPNNPFGNGEPVQTQGPGALENSEEFTGSGSLLSSSESEGWARRGSLPWAQMTTGLNGMTNAQHGRNSASPARPRTNQHTRSNSPFSNGQVSAIGSANGKPSRTAFDPRSQSFNPSANVAAPSFDGRQDEPARRPQQQQQQSLNFGAIGGNMAQPYSGYVSGSQSRSGSLPPSRHGNEPGTQLGDLTLTSLQSSNADIFSHRPNQQSRNNFPAPAINRLGDPTWGATLSDLAGDMDRLDIESDGASAMTSQGMPPSPGSMNGGFNAFSFSRNSSISYDSEMRGAPQQAFNQYRMGYGDRATHSPSGSETRHSHDSPVFFSGTPPVLEPFQRAPSNPSSRGNAAAGHYNQVALERKLRNLAAEQQAYSTQSTPAMSYRQPFYNSYDVTPQAMARMNPNTQFYPNMQSMGGYAAHHNSSGRAPPRGPSVDSSAGQSLRSPLLEEFRSSKGNKRYELKVGTLMQGDGRH